MAYGSETRNIENVVAKLVPFDLQEAAAGGTATVMDSQSIIGGGITLPNLWANVTGRILSQIGLSDLFDSITGGGSSSGGGGGVQSGGGSNSASPISPIYKTGGLVFPYVPSISEGMSVKYDAVEVVHSNEAYHAYRSTDNVKIELSNCVWTCDTFDNAVYALAALHFFRTYSLMDFGAGRTGRPPSPMWFSAYGNYAYHRVPCLLERAVWSFPNDVDYVGVPEPGSAEWNAGQLATNRAGGDGPYTWMPVKFEVSSVSLIVQHSPRYWLGFNLDDYRSGQMLRSRGSFHVTT